MTGLSKAELEDADKIWDQIRKTSKAILSPSTRRPSTSARSRSCSSCSASTASARPPRSASSRRAGKAKAKVLVAAGDTFRAAATEQLEEWARRAEVDIVKGKAGGDPSSVVFDAIKKGVAESYDIVICDTAGRLH